MLLVAGTAVTAVTTFFEPRLRLREINGNEIASSISENIGEAADEREDESFGSRFSSFLAFVVSDDSPFATNVWTADANDLVSGREMFAICDALSVTLMVSLAILEVLIACCTLHWPCLLSFQGYKSTRTRGRTSAGDLRHTSFFRAWRNGREEDICSSRLHIRKGKEASTM